MSMQMPSNAQQMLSINSENAQQILSKCTVNIQQMPSKCSANTQKMSSCLIIPNKGMPLSSNLENGFA